jgi:hypothetical protein
MSISIVLLAGALGALGAETVLVMAAPVGLCSAQTAALGRLAWSPSSLWPQWLRPRKAR